MWKNPSTFIVLSNVKKIEISLDKKRKITYQFFSLVSVWVWKEKGSYCTYFWYALQYLLLFGSQLLSFSQNFVRKIYILHLRKAVRVVGTTYQDLCSINKRIQKFDVFTKISK